MTNVVLRACDISWTGGCCIRPGPRFKRNPLECTRYGNSMDIWEHAENVEVYDNRMWEAYDTGITPQGTTGLYVQRNLSFHHNIIGHAEYCFELWDQSPIRNDSLMDTIRIESNVCFDSGGGWSHAQRPDPSGRHICMFSNSGTVKKISIVNNIFFQSVPYEAAWWMFDPWSSPASHDPAYCKPPRSCGWNGPTTIREDYNVWYETKPGLGKALIVLGDTGSNWSRYYNLTDAGFAAYRRDTGNGAHSLRVDPTLLGLLPPDWAVSNATDMHPAATSPVRGAGAPGLLWRRDFAGKPILGKPNIGAFQ
jgi:hypothetical protein